MILIAEHQPLQTIGLEVVLRSRGHRVASATTQVAALQIIDRERVKLAIVGLMLPELADGAALAKALAARGVPVIVYTGLSQKRVRDALGDVTPAAVVVKPASDQTLLAAIGKALQPKD